MKSKTLDWETFWLCHSDAHQKVKTFLSREGVLEDRFCFYYEAFVHRSASTECTKVDAPWNERLEFLGDSVLGLSVSSLLWNGEEEWTEGELSSKRSNLVSRRALASLSRFLDLGPCLALGMGEKRQRADEQDSLLANMFEAVIGAMFLDAGYEKTSCWIQCVYRRWQDHVQMQKDIQVRDSKTCLQEWAQKDYGQTPSYTLLSQVGPSHAPQFEMAVMLGDVKVAQAVSKTKKEASQQAAEKALKSLENGKRLI
ncbi:MAG: ribonuclease III [Oligoflexales bacterium]